MPEPFAPTIRYSHDHAAKCSCARAPQLPGPQRGQSTGAGGGTIFETFKAQNAEICTPRRPCPPHTLDHREARARARGSTIFETKLKTPKFVLPRARAPQLPGPQRGQSTGAGGVRFSRLSRLKMPKSVLPGARVPPTPWTIERPEHGRGGVRFSRQSSKRRNLYSLAPVPPSSLDPREARARARGGYDFRDFQGSKCRNLLPCARAPPPPWSVSTIFETFRAQKAEICTPRSLREVTT